MDSPTRAREFICLKPPSPPEVSEALLQGPKPSFRHTLIPLGAHSSTMHWIHLLSSSTLSKHQRAGERTRSPFEQDYDRIIFSHPFRRLQDKTQVHPLPEH